MLRRPKRSKIEVVAPEEEKGSIHTSSFRLVSWMSWNSIQFSFGALIYVYSFSLFGVYKLDVHESVRRDTIIKVANKMQLYEYRLIYYF